MISNYFKMAFRQLTKNKQHTFINVIGLAIGFAVCLVIAGYVYHEYSFENNYKNKDRIYRVTTFAKFGTSNFVLAAATPPLGPAIKESLPEIENYVRFYSTIQPKFKINNAIFEEKKIFFSDPSFVDIFNTSFLYGNPRTALTAPYSIIIDEATAQKYFGNSSALGKIISYISRGKQYDYSVTGVFKNMPSNTVLRTSFIASASTPAQLEYMNQTKWNPFDNCFTFLLLKKNANISDLEKKIDQIGQKNLGAAGKGSKYELQSLKNIYFHSLSNDLVYTANPERILVFSIIAGLILLLACINYINLNTAKIISRLKETAVRKTCGAERSQLIFQFLVESSLVILLSMFIGIVFFYLLKPLLEKFIEQDLMIGLLSNPEVPLMAFGLVVFVILFAAFYPALVLSSHKATALFKPNSGLGEQRSLIRKILVTAQYTITIGVIIYVMTIAKQTNYMENKDLGFDKGGMITFNRTDTAMAKILRNELKKIPSIKTFTQLAVFPSEENRAITNYTLGGNDQENMAQIISTDSEFINTFGVHLINGRNFTSSSASDKFSVLVNETFIKANKIANPIGFKITYGSLVYEIIGVVKDFHTNSLRSEIYPLIIRNSEFETQSLSCFVVRYHANLFNEAVKNISGIWKRLSDQQFIYKLSEEAINAAYKKENALLTLLFSFCVMIIIVACLGILGLASYMAERRTKEIGVRKVLGASVKQILFMLSKDFIFWVSIANIFAWPLAYWATNDWLNNFPYRISLNAFDFVIAGTIALSIALITSSVYTIKSAVTNPANSLRYE